MTPLFYFTLYLYIYSKCVKGLDITCFMYCYIFRKKQMYLNENKHFVGVFRRISYFSQKGHFPLTSHTLGYWFLASSQRSNQSGTRGHS